MRSKMLIFCGVLNMLELTLTQSKIISLIILLFVAALILIFYKETGSNVLQCRLRHRKVIKKTFYSLPYSRRLQSLVLLTLQGFQQVDIGRYIPKFLIQCSGGMIMTKDMQSNRVESQCAHFFFQYQKCLFSISVAAKQLCNLHVIDKGSHFPAVFLYREPEHTHLLSRYSVLDREKVLIGRGQSI